MYTVYSIVNCVYCDKAKELLRNRGEAFHDIAADMKPAIAAHIVELTGQRTWPQIFKDDTFIGGYTELKKDT